MNSDMALLPALSSVLCLVLVASTAFALPDAHWSLFKSKFGKSYKDADEEAMRRDIFIKNKEHVDYFNAHQAQKAGYTKGLNHMSDWTPEEFASINKLRQPQQDPRDESIEADDYLDELLNSDEPVPDAHDWRTVEGRVTSVKNQGYCASCWAFSVTGVLEGQQKPQLSNKTKSLVSLSEQELVDCTKKNWGCDGGWPYTALDAIRTLGGVESEESYPYEGRDSECRFDEKKVVISDKGYKMLPKGDEEALKKAIYRYGPVSVVIYSTNNMQSYRSGILDDDSCRRNPETNHAVLVVGYGTDEATKRDYWIVKNSWGKEWGMDGYVLMSRNAKNQCLIASYAVLATF